MKRVLAAAALVALASVLVGRATAAQSSGPIVVRLPKHVFGHFRTPDARIVSARWGRGPGQVGLVKAEAGPTGGSSFDVLNDVVCVLDQHNGRVLVYDHGQMHATPLTVGGKAGAVFRGVDSSLAVGADGTIYVAEPTDSAHRNPTLRSFPSHGGAPLATVSTAGSNPIVRATGKTAYVAQTLAGPWKASMTAGRVVTGATTPYRPSLDGSRVQVSGGGPLVVKLKTSDGKQLSWRVTSPDHVSVEDAESFGGIEVVLALRVSSAAKTEYEVLILSGSGLLDSFSAPDDEYTSTALFDDFRVDGSTVYHRGSTKKGLYVDYYSF